jgi:DNA-directed RNA polymerase specialized sigma24 family protein
MQPAFPKAATSCRVSNRLRARALGLAGGRRDRKAGGLARLILRLRAIARLRARSLPGGISWSDLLHEAVVRALAGSRPWPPGVPLLAFLAGVMRSLCDEQWRRRRRQDALPAHRPGF